MAFVLFEDSGHFDLRPFSFTRPVFTLRCGIFTALERWQHLLEQPVRGLGYGILQTRYPHLPELAIHTWINGRVLPNETFLQQIREVPEDTFFLDPQGVILAARFSPSLLPENFDGLMSQEKLEEMGLRPQRSSWQGLQLRFPEDIFKYNGQMLAFDFRLLHKLHPHQSVKDRHSRIYGADNLYVHPTAQIHAAIINAEDGPVYIGNQVNIQEGALIHGAHAFLNKSRVSMGAKLRGETTLGPHSKLGGEVSNSVIMGYANKGHEGYLGNSVLGYWCNLGADTNTSNLKNNYTNVKVWHFPSGRFRDTGLQFCGLLMGDHSKCGINTMFNTGTVVGVSANIFGSGYPRTYIPSFSWGGAARYTTYRLQKALETAALVMPRKGAELDEAERNILSHVYEQSAPARIWDQT